MNCEEEKLMREYIMQHNQTATKKQVIEIIPESDAGLIEYIKGKIRVFALAQKSLENMIDIVTNRLTNEDVQKDICKQKILSTLIDYSAKLYHEQRECLLVVSKLNGLLDGILASTIGE